MARALVCPNGHEGAAPDGAFCIACGAALVPAAGGPSLPGVTRRQALFAAAGALILLVGAVALSFALRDESGDTNRGGVARTSGGSPASQQTPFATTSALQGAGADQTSTPAVPTASETAAQPTPATAGALPTVAPAATPLPPTAAPALPTPTPPPTYTNLVGNGGFETGSLSAPWGTGIYEPRSEVFWGRADADAVVVSDSVHGGRFALRITNQSPQAPQIYGTLAQQVAVKGGQQYCLTWWARTANALNGIMNFRMNDAWTIVPSIGAGLPDYTRYAWTFVAEDNNIDLRIVSENTGTVWVDDIEMSEGACKVPNGPISGGASPR